MYLYRISNSYGNSKFHNLSDHIGAFICATILVHRKKCSYHSIWLSCGGFSYFWKNLQIWRCSLIVKKRIKAHAFKLLPLV